MRGAIRSKELFRFFILLLCAGLFITGQVDAQPEKSTPKDAILLTIFLKHDQSKTLDEIQAQLKKNGFYQNFPPEGVEVVSWYVLMGIGQVVTLRVPAGAGKGQASKRKPTQPWQDDFWSSAPD